MKGTNEIGIFITIVSVALGILVISALPPIKIPCTILTYQPIQLQFRTSNLTTYYDGLQIFGQYLYKDQYAQIAITNIDSANGEFGVVYKYQVNGYMQTDTIKKTIDSGNTVTFNSKMPTGALVNYDLIVPTKLVPVTSTGICEKSIVDIVLDLIFKRKI